LRIAAADGRRVAAPDVSAQALDRVRQQRLVMLLSTRDDPDAIAARRLSRAASTVRRM